MSDIYEKFTAEYEVHEPAPRLFSIDSDLINTDMDEGDLEQLYEDEVQQHFEQYVTPKYRNMAEFMIWARNVLKKKNAEKK